MGTLPSGWSYHCAASSTYRNVDGTGWVPINFTKLPGGSPSGALPVDPVNQTSTFLYYSYVTNTSYEYQLYAHFESPSYQPQEADAGTPGIDPTTYKLGTNVNIAPFAGGLAADWPMDEGSGSTINDLSGDGYTGTINGATWTSSGCNIGQTNCLSFNGTDAYVQAAANIIGVQPISTCAWIWQSPSYVNSYSAILYNLQYSLVLYEPDVKLILNNSSMASGASTPCCSSVPLSSWHYVCATRDSNGTANLYVDGVNLVADSEYGGAPTAAPGWSTVIGQENNDDFFTGDISGVRIFSRTLSPTEIQNLYSAGG